MLRHFVYLRYLVLLRSPSLTIEELRELEALEMELGV